MSQHLLRSLMAGALGLCVALSIAPSAAGQHFSDCFSTTTNATLLVPEAVSASLGSSGDGLSSGDEIALLTGDGQCVGVGTWQQANLAIAIAGANSQESAGYEEGQSLRFRVWDASAQVTYEPDASFTSCQGGNPLCRSDGLYEADAFYALASLTADTDPPSDDTDPPAPVEVVDVTANQYPDLVGQTLDDDLATRWGANGYGASIEYELASEATLDQLGIAWYRGDKRQTHFEIALSTDGTTWTTVHDGSSSGSTMGLEYYSFAATPARHIRITGFGNTENTWTSITEVTFDEPDGGSSPAMKRAIDQPIEEVITELALDSNYPNPFGAATTIEYALPEPTHVVLEVFDILGRRIARLVDQERPAGRHRVRVDASDWTSGTYLYRLRAAGETRTGRMTVIR